MANSSNDELVYNKAITDEVCKTALAFDPFCTHSGSQFGYYEIIQNYVSTDTSTPSSFHGNIVYTDIVSGKQIYLCSNPSCAHDTNTCSSWVNTNAYTTVAPAAIDDHLIIMYCGNANGRSSKIEIMDADGTNRKLLCEFDYNIELFNGLAFDSDHIYVYVMEANPNGVLNDNTYKLLSISLADSSTEEILTIKRSSDEESKMLFILGCSEKGFVYKTIATKKMDLANGMAPSDYTQMINSSVSHDYYVLPYDGSEPIFLFHHGMEDGEFKYLGDSVYFMPLYTDDPYFYRYNCNTCEKEVLFESVKDALTENGIKPAEKVRFYKAWQICNNTVFFVDYIEQYDEGTLRWEERSNQYAFDLSTRRITKTDLYNEYGYNSDEYTVEPVYIWAQFGDTLLVSSSISIEGNYYMHDYSLISADDYINSRPNYREISMIDRNNSVIRK